MATLEVKKIQFDKRERPELNGGEDMIICEVEDIMVFDGVIHFIPKNKRYQHYRLNTGNCKIIK